MKNPIGTIFYNTKQNFHWLVLDIENFLCFQEDKTFQIRQVPERRLDDEEELFKQWSERWPTIKI